MFQVGSAISRVHSRKACLVIPTAFREPVQPLLITLTRHMINDGHVVLGVYMNYAFDHPTCGVRALYVISSKNEAGTYSCTAFIHVHAAAMRGSTYVFVHLRLKFL